MKIKILLTFLMLLVAAPVVFAGWIDDNGEPSWLVHAQVFTRNGTYADGADYTIRTYNHDAGGELLSVQTGFVGEIIQDHLYNSRNLIDSAGDTVVVEIDYRDESITVVHVVTAAEEELHVINLGNITLGEDEDDEEEEEETTGVDVTKVRLTRGEYLSVGELLGTGVRIANNYDMDLEDVKLTVGVPELGVRKTAGPFDLDDGDEELKNLYIELPEWAKPGEYYIRIEISNEELHRVLHRSFEIIH
ncbi:hypothetical protein KY312_04525 [Candidatus Woesearchaeota archaeon]|nr:hypothetical protein [Candidatus Woesearchaeota archaeon]